jgi:hypothetical protein
MRGLPTSGRVADITFSAKPRILLISPIDCVNDIYYTLYKISSTEAKMVRTFEITQGQLAEAIIGLAQRVEILERAANEHGGREIDTVLAAHHLKTAKPALAALEVLFATTFDEELAA